MTVETKPGFATTWIFAAVYQVGKAEGSLDELVGHADALNRAIPSKGEICRALSFMESHGLGCIKDERIVVTDSGKYIYADARKKRGGLFEVPKNVLKSFKKALNFNTPIEKRHYEFVNEVSLKEAY